MNKEDLIYSLVDDLRKLYNFAKKTDEILIRYVNFIRWLSDTQVEDELDMFIVEVELEKFKKEVKRIENEIEV